MKTLWIGCSHSAGTYDLGNKNISGFGIPSAVGKSFDYKNWKIIACPGYGIIEFSNILTELYYNDLLNFDNIIIQLTTEPRLIGLEKEAETLKYPYLFEYIRADKNTPYRLDADVSHPKEFKTVFNMNPISLYELYIDTFPRNTKIDLGLLKMTKAIYNSLSKSLIPNVRQGYRNIVDICTKENINLYVFNYIDGKEATYRHLTNINYEKYDILGCKGLYEISTEAEKEKFYHPENCHPLEGAVINKSKVIINALKEHGFKG